MSATIRKVLNSGVEAAGWAKVSSLQFWWCWLSSALPSSASSWVVGDLSSDLWSETQFFFFISAPPLEKYEETFTLSALLASLTLFPVSIFIGVSGTVSILFTESFELVNVVSQAYLKLLKRNAFLVIFGAFVGSAVFPLDWDRPWQIYPIPNFVGSITGQMMGCFYCFFESMVNYKLGKKQR